MSGISAAKRLKELGYYNFEILEGSDRVGGRVQHETIGGFTVEMGHTFTMGLGKNPVWAIMQQYNVTHKIVDYDDWIVRNTDGSNVTEQANIIYDEYYNAVDVMDANDENARQNKLPDYSVRAALRKAGWKPGSFLADVIEYFEIDWMYGVNPDESSGKYTFLETPEEHEEFLNSSDEAVPTDQRGFATVLRQVLDEIIENDSGKLKLNKIINEIEQTNEKVMVKTNDGTSYEADYVIVTFSLGVLQNNRVTFKPALPEWKVDSIHQFQMTQFTNVYVQFSSAFWDDNEWILYAGETDNFNIIMNMNKYLPGSNTLYIEATDRESIRLERLSDSAVIEQVRAKLQKIYPSLSLPSPVGFKISRFSTNPLFYGAWSNWPPGFTKDSHDALKAPVGRIYFSGEHTSMMSYGYIQGAYFSGSATVSMLDQCIQRSVCQKYVPVYAARGCRYTAASNFNHAVKEDDGSCKFPCVSGADRIRISLGMAAILVLITYVYL